MKELTGLYPNTKRLKIVLDNLNAHGYDSFYEYFKAETAVQLIRKIEFIFTPKYAFRLNMIETKFSVLAKQC